MSAHEYEAWRCVGCRRLPEEFDDFFAFHITTTRGVVCAACLTADEALEEWTRSSRLEEALRASEEGAA